MTWLGSVPTVVLCALLVTLPGLVITFLVGLRGLAAVALAPTAVVGVVATTAVAAGALGIPWSPLLVVLVFAGIAVLLAVTVLPLRDRLPRPEPRDGRPVLVAAAVGVLGAMLIGALTVARVITGPEELIESSDSPFHYNAIVHILNSGQASSFGIDTLGVPGRVGGFYPAAWHDLGSLLVMITGVSVPAAANILSVTIALLVWPLGCLLLARQLIGPSPLVVGLAGFLSVGFGAFPWDLLGWGILWPNLLGLALVPAALGTALAAFGLAQDDVVGRRRAWVLAPGIVAAVGLAHPNAVISLVAIAVPPAAVAVGAIVRSRYRQGDRWVAGLLVAALALAGPAYWFVVAKSGLFDRTMDADSPPFETASHAVGEVLTGATNGWAAGWALAALVVVGAVATFRQRARRWLVVSHAISGLLYVLAAGVPGADRRLLTGFWYTDSHRLAAMLPITGVPLAAIGIVALIGLVQAAASRLGGAPQAVFARRASVLAVPAVVALLLLLTGGLYSADNGARVLVAYPKVDPLIDQEEYALFTRIAEHVAPDAVVAQMPLNGSPAVMTLTRRQVLFPQLNTGRATPEHIYLARNLVRAPSSPRVCEVANRLGVRYLLTNDKPWGTMWDGLTYPDPDQPGFRLLDQGGTMKLYRITACDARTGSERER